MRKVALSLVVLSTLILLIAPALAQQWQKFYLDPSDPHFIRIEDPAKRLRDEGDKWVSDCLRGHPRPKIYFKILEFGDKGGFIKFWYATSKEGYGWNQLHLYASKDGKKYVELWKCDPWGIKDKTEVTVKVPPGYKYFYFYLRDGNFDWEKLILWKEIQFKTLAPPIPKAKIEVVDIEGYITTTALGAGIATLIYLLTRMR